MCVRERARARERERERERERVEGAGLVHSGCSILTRPCLCFDAFCRMLTVCLVVMVDAHAGVATHRVYPTADQRAVALINTGSVDVSITATVYPMSVAQPPTMDELLN